MINVEMKVTYISPPKEYRSYTGTTLYGNKVTLPAVSHRTTVDHLFEAAERTGCVRIENHLGDVFIRKRKGEWHHSWTKEKKNV